MRVLFFLIFFLVLFLAVKSRIRSMQENFRKSVKEEFEAQAAQRPAAQPENMVACAQCQMYLPASEAVQVVTPSSRQYFCSEAHLKAFSGQSTISSPTSTHE